MVLLFLVLISPFLGIIAFKLSEKTKIPLMLLLIVVGMIFGVSGFINIFGIEALQPSIATYSSLISITLIFIMAGFSMDFDLIMANKKATMKLGFIPVYITLVVVAIAAFAYFKIVGLNDLGTTSETFNIFGAIIFAFMIALSAPVLVVPAGLRLKPTEKPVGVTMIAGSIIDNYTALPLAFITIAIGAIFSKGGQLSLLMIVGIIVIIVIGILTMAALGLYVGKLFTKLLLKLNFMNDLILNKPMIACTIYSILCIITTILVGYVPVVGGLLKSLVLVYIIMYGAGIAIGMNDEQKNSMKPSWQKFLLLFGLPIMFLGLGGRTDLTVLLNLKIIGFIITMFIVNRGVKTYITRKVLKSEGFNEEEQTIGAKLAMFDGASPVNLSIALTPALIMIGQTDIATLTAAYGIALYALTIPLGEKLLSKNYN